MTEKVLIKYTTIPQHLYVNRKADEQLKSIVDEMQRPGYVLVARQMGKTNLLFNAKRTLENENRLFVYVDLSNVYAQEHDCYRNIIDCVIEPNEELFEPIQSEIQRLRENKLPPHKEYSKSLRLVLKQFMGDLVIILDEIDALRSTDYSDNIFAQIRSTYFSRTNFPVLERLTYILSGVIEPTDLIKDRNKSPFNIGEKIYLNDFSKGEYHNFIKKSALRADDTVIYEIYEWTRGNPRLTFDVCSAVESYLIENNNITVDELGELIGKKYLTSYDIAPIDNIRNIVKSNKLIRNAVVKIKKDDNSGLSDEIKRKLYLAGITDSSFNEDTVIKNRIIDESLSSEWLDLVVKQSQDNFSYGLELVNKREFKEALPILLDVVQSSAVTKSQLEVCNYHIGFSYFQLEDLQAAHGYFLEEYSKPLYKQNSLSFLGVCKFGIGEVEEGISILEGIIEEGTKDFAYRNSILNLAPIISPDDRERGISLYDLLFEATFDSTDEPTAEEMDRLRVLAQYYKSEILFKHKEVDKALECVLVALKYANPSDSLFLDHLRYSLEEKKDEQIKLKIVTSIVEQKLKFADVQLYPFNFSKEHILKYLDFVFDSSAPQLFEELLGYAEEELNEDKKGKLFLAYNSCRFSNQPENTLKYLLNFKESMSNDLLINIYRDLSLINTGDVNTFFSYFDEYQALLNHLGKVTREDLYIFAYAINHNSDLNRIKTGLGLCDLITSKIDDTDSEGLGLDTVIIYYWYASLFFSMKNRKQSIHYANKTIKLIDESKAESTSLVDEKGFKSIRTQMEQIRASSINRVPTVHERKFGRNERVKVKYSNGEVIEGKYKKLMADILSGRCEIIS